MTQSACARIVAIEKRRVFICLFFPFVVCLFVSLFAQQNTLWNYNCLAPRYFLLIHNKKKGGKCWFISGSAIFFLSGLCLEVLHHWKANSYCFSWALSALDNFLYCVHVKQFFFVRGRSISPHIRPLKAACNSGSTTWKLHLLSITKTL